MFDTMEASQGVGLAAPQVNANLRLFIMGQTEGTYALPQPEKWPGWVFINPDVVEMNGLLKTEVEGCLSIPGIEVSLARPMYVRLQYLDENYQKQERTFSGFVSRVVQHEYDHVDGVLMTDRMNKHRQKSLRYYLNRIAKGLVEADYELLTEQEPNNQL